MSYKLSDKTNNGGINITQLDMQYYNAYLSSPINLTTSYQDIVSLGSMAGKGMVLIIATIYEDLSGITQVSTAPVESRYDLYVGGLFTEEVIGANLPVSASAIPGINKHTVVGQWITSWSGNQTVKIQGKLVTSGGSITGNWTVGVGSYSTKIIMATLK